MTPPDARNDWTVGYIVNLQGSVVDRWRADGSHRAGRAFALASRGTPECPARSRLTLDERVVALNPPVRGEDEEVEPDSKRLAVLGSRTFTSAERRPGSSTIGKDTPADASIQVDVLSLG
jgi:hypothetical protein